MNVHVSDELVKRLHDLAAASGRKPDDLVQDALAGYLDEVTALRETLDARYQGFSSSSVQPMSADDVLRRFQDKSRTHRQSA